MKAKKTKFAGLHVWTITFQSGTFTSATATVLTERYSPVMAIEKFEAWFTSSDWNEGDGRANITRIDYNGTVDA